MSRAKSFVQALFKAMTEVAGTDISGLTGTALITLLESQLVENLGAYIIQVRADNEIYGELQKNLKQQYTLGHKNYKMDVNDAMEVLILNQQNKKSVK